MWQSRRRDFLLIPCLLLLCWCGSLSCGETQGQVVALPNPLQLENGWWEYFEGDPEQLPGKTARFEGSLDQFLGGLDEEEHSEAHERAKQIAGYLKSYESKLKQIETEQAPKLQLRKQYTLDQYLELYKSLYHNKIDITRLEEKVLALNFQYERKQSLLDKYILRYRDLPQPSNEKLLLGLNIIEVKIQMQIDAKEASTTRSSINYLQNESDLLESELSAAEGRLSFKEESWKELQKKLVEEEKQAQEQQRKLIELETEVCEVGNSKSELDCCHKSYCLLTQKIEAENSATEALIAILATTLHAMGDESRENDPIDLESYLSNWSEKIVHFKEGELLLRGELADYQRKASLLVSNRYDKEDADAFHKTMAEIHIQLDKAYVTLEALRFHLGEASLLYSLIEKHFVRDRGITETWTLSVKTQVRAFADKVQAISNVSIFRINDQPITLGILAKSLLILLIAFLFSSSLQKLLTRRKIIIRAFSKSTEYIVLRIIHYGVIILALIFALGFLGLDFRNIAIVAGALGVGIGFGLQSMVSNILSGFMLLLNKYLKIGDIVELPGKIIGRVTSVSLQNTQIESFDGINVVLPNSQLTSERWVNWTMYDFRRRFKLPFGVAYSTDKVKMRQLILQRIALLPFVMGEKNCCPKPEIWLVAFGESSLNFELVVWVDLSITPKYGTAYSSLMWELHSTLIDNGISIPFPQREVRVLGEGEKG